MLADTPPTGEKWCASVGYMDGKLYSYGRHYPLLWKVTTPNGRNVLVCNRAGYSNTTAKHISWCHGVADVYVRGIGNIGDLDCDEVKTRLHIEIGALVAEHAGLKRKNTKKAERMLADIEQLNGFLEKLD